MGDLIAFELDGETVHCPPGLTVAAALFQLGRRWMRTTGRLERPRGFFCGMGVCHDCAMRIDGVSGVRSCCTLVRPGLSVATERGDADLGELR